MKNERGRNREGERGRGREGGREGGGRKQGREMGREEGREGRRKQQVCADPPLDTKVAVTFSTSCPPDKCEV